MLSVILCQIVCEKGFLSSQFIINEKQFGELGFLKLSN